MLASDIPGFKFPIPFANGADAAHRTAPIPTATTGSYRASLTLGYPPETFLATGAGGTPPDGRDFNGILYEITGWNRWQQAGGPIQYDATFSAAIGGYPAGAVLMSNPAGILWRSTADNNLTNPDASGAGWVPLLPIKAPDPEDTGDDTNFVTPAGLEQVLEGRIPADAVINTNGSYPFPGIIMKWGRFSITGPSANLNVSFNAPFPNNCFSVVVGGGNNTTAQDNQISLVGNSITTSQFQARFVPTGSATGTYQAIGN